MINDILKIIYDVIVILIISIIVVLIVCTITDYDATVMYMKMILNFILKLKDML